MFKEESVSLYLIATKVFYSMQRQNQLLRTCTLGVKMESLD